MARLAMLCSTSWGRLKREGSHRHLRASSGHIRHVLPQLPEDTQEIE